MEETRRGYSRRRMLAFVGATGLAGCSSSEGDQPAPGETTNGETSTPTTERTTTVERVDDRHELSVAHEAPAYDMEWAAPTETSPELEAEAVIENLEIPWDLSFGNDGTLFITERVGRLRAFDGEEARVVAEPADAIDAGSVDPGEDHDSWWVHGGEGGTLGVAAHPEYPSPPVGSRSGRRTTSGSPVVTPASARRPRTPRPSTGPCSNSHRRGNRPRATPASTTAGSTPTATATPRVSSDSPTERPYSTNTATAARTRSTAWSRAGTTAGRTRAFQRSTPTQRTSSDRWPAVDATPGHHRDRCSTQGTRCPVYKTGW